MQKEAIEGNALIAEFLQIPKHGCSTPNCYEYGNRIFYSPDKMQYYTSWDWLMPVVEKIEEGLFYVKIRENRCAINGYRKYSHLTFLTQEYGKPKIQATYESVIQFIQYHNSLNSK